MLVCLYSCRGEKAKTKKTENRQFRKEEKNRRNVSRKLRKIQEIPDEDKPAKKRAKRAMKLITEKMPKKTQLQLIVAADNVPTTGGKSTLLKKVVQNIITEGNNPQKMLTAVKNLPISDGLKNRIFSTHKQGFVTRMKYAVLSKIPNSAKNNLSLVLSITLEILNFVMTAVQEIKDLGLIATIYFFFKEVLQKRAHLIDGINLMDFVTLLCGIYAFVVMLKLLRTSSTLTRKENDRISLKARLVPFFVETFTSLKIIQGIIKLFSLKKKITKTMKRQLSTEKAEVWEKIADTCEQINRAEAHLEKRQQARMRLKICSVLGDIMQASVLAILLLRSDLRVRGALISLRKMNIVGGKSEDGGTQGKRNHRLLIPSCPWKNRRPTP